MPTITDDFLTSPLGYSGVNAGGVSVNGTTVNLDTATGGTGQIVTMDFTIPSTPAGSPDMLWDEVSFTYTWESVNNSVGTDQDHTRVILSLQTGTGIGQGTVQYASTEHISEANATVSVQNGTYTVTFNDIAAGSYRLFLGESDTGDGEALNVSVIGGSALEEVPCFARGSLIETANGPVAIESLVTGDLILTGNGLKPIRWIGSRKFDADILAAKPNLRPIRIHAGALGQETPATDLVVSPQHRVLVRSKIAQRMFGAEEVLVAAKQLLELDGVEIAEDLVAVEYFHLMFDQHEIIVSNGAKTESLYAGKQALLAIGEAARKEIFAIFPELQDYSADVAPAAYLASGRLARQLAKRHKKNAQPLVAA